MQFTPVAHFTAVYARPAHGPDLATKLPWLYLIASLGSRLIYIGQTFDEGGIAARLSAHFGRFVNSTFKQRADMVARTPRLRSPHLIMCARLPFGDEGAAFDGGSKQVRLVCEALLHESVGMGFVTPRGDWTIVSTPTPGLIKLTSEMKAACASIYDCFQATFTFAETLSQASPFQIVVLEAAEAERVPTEEDLGRLIEEIELSVFARVIGSLRREYGDSWWTDGIPEQVRVQCVTKREQEPEGQSLPAEAYLTLIDLRDIVRKNWRFFAAQFEEIGDRSGKDRATQWIVDINEVRKLWAHPIKRLHQPVEPQRVLAVRTLYARVRDVFGG